MIGGMIINFQSADTKNTVRRRSETVINCEIKRVFRQPVFICLPSCVIRDSSLRKGQNEADFEHEAE